MSSKLDFYFDYSSPYGYLASERVESIANKHGRELVWHPILLGAVFKVTGQAPLTEAPLKGEYAITDFHRSARQHNIEYSQPDMFPIASVSACRASLWIREHEDADVAARLPDFIHGVFRAFYTQGKNITDAAVLAEIAESSGLDSSAMADAIAQETIKNALRKEVNDAIERGIFGSPMIMIDDELFWGHDRLEHVDHWLETGGW